MSRTPGRSDWKVELVAEAGTGWREVTSTRSEMTGFVDLHAQKHRPGVGNSKSYVFLLKGIGPGKSDVVAKLCRDRAAQLDALFLGDVLPSIGLDGLRCYGRWPSQSGFQWVFMDSALGQLAYDTSKPDHVLAASRWLRILHAETANAGHLASMLPSSEKAYLELAIEARLRISVGLNNPKASPEHLPTLKSLYQLLGHVIDRWHMIAAWIAEWPAGVAHSDFVSKNVRLSRDPRCLHVYDWEGASWGSPAPDVATSGILNWGDAVASYLLNRKASSMTGVEELRSVGELGVALRMLASISWATTMLPHSNAARTFSSLRAFGDTLERSLAKRAVLK